MSEEQDMGGLHPLFQEIMGAHGAPAAPDPHSLGMARVGETVRFLGKNGHDFELQDALEQFEVGQVLLVSACQIGSWVSYYRFIDESGSFNTVMFEPTAQNMSGPSHE